MALTVGTDTYISLADTWTYLAENYLSTDSKLLAWIALQDADKEVLLRKATRLIDSQPVAGVKATSSQTLAFPRATYTDYADYSGTYSDDGAYPGYRAQSGVPSAVQYAQVEIALVLASGTPTRLAMQQQGVKSYSIGNLSETLGGAGIMARIPSAEAVALLRPYLAGALEIR